MSKIKRYDEGYNDGRMSVINDRKYNGWSNYETWNVKLWIDNDEGSHDYWESVVASKIGHDSPEYNSDADNVKCQIADMLKDEHNEAMPELTGTYADLLNGALSEVNWYEIAEAMVNDYIADNPETLAS